MDCNLRYHPFLLTISEKVISCKLDSIGGFMERQTISIMKACALVNVSRRTIYNWIASGKVEYVRTAGGSIRIFVDSLWRNPDGSKRESI